MMRNKNTGCLYSRYFLRPGDPPGSRILPSLPSGERENFRETLWTAFPPYGTIRLSYKERMIPVLKKLASLLLSLLLCLSLLPCPACAADMAENSETANQIDFLDIQSPDDPDSLIMPTAGDFPEKDPVDKTED